MPSSGRTSTAAFSIAAEFRRVLALHRQEPHQAAPAALGTRIHAGRRRRT